jgi:DNA repair protein RadD
MLQTEWPYIRIGILTHKRELITQAHDKLVSVWPEAKIGIACASVEKQIATEEPVVIGSIQTLIRRVDETSPFDIIIIDEAHRIPPINEKSMYQKFIKDMREYNREVRIIGCTATPYRLGHGYIFGTGCKPSNENLFEKLHYNINIRTLQDQGYLCEYIAKEAVDVRTDLKGVKVSGDYNQGQLGEMMSNVRHLGSAVKAVEDYASGRKRIVIFCVTIDHAERMVKKFIKAGIQAAYIHSKMPNAQRDMVLREFEQGRIRVVCNIGVLTEGWDSPAVDCILMCRPTKSPALYVQMVGRGLRPHPDKENVLILDLSSNCMYHGDPNNPRVTIGKDPNVGPRDPLKPCPNCDLLVPIATRECPECGHLFKEEAEDDNAAKKMQDVAWQRKPAPIVARIDEIRVEDYTSRAGNRMLKLAMKCKPDHSIMPIRVNHFWDFEAEASPRGQEHARKLWKSLVGSRPPDTVSEAVQREDELLVQLPPEIEVVKKNNWWNVTYWGVKPWNKKEDEHGVVDEIPF